MKWLASNTICDLASRTILGFLASWLSNHNPLTIIAYGFLLAVIMVGEDALQFTANLPSAAMFILIGLTLFLVLGFGRFRRSNQ